MQTPTKKPIIYQAKDGALELRGDVDAQTIWASQKQMSEIFGVNSQAITKHINNIYKEDELKKKKSQTVHTLPSDMMRTRVKSGH